MGTIKTRIIPFRVIWKKKQKFRDYKKRKGYEKIRARGGKHSSKIHRIMQRGRGRTCRVKKPNDNRKRKQGGRGWAKEDENGKGKGEREKSIEIRG